MRLIFFFLVVIIGFSACQEGETNTTQTQEVTTPGFAAHPNPLEGYATHTNEGVFVFHAFIDIMDSTQSPTTRFLSDTLKHAFDTKYLYVDKRFEIIPVNDPNVISPELLDNAHPYFVQMHVAKAPSSGNFQHIQMTYNPNETAYVHLGKRLENAKIVGTGGIPGTEFFEECYDGLNVSCRAKFNLKTIAGLCFQ